MTCFGQKWADLGSYVHPSQSTGAPGVSGPSKSSPKGHLLIRPTHSHGDLCPSIMLEAGGLGCAARWGCFVRGLCFSQLCGSCYPPVLQNTRKELSGRDVSLLVPQPPKRDGAPYAFSEMILQRVIERLRHGSLWRTWKQRAQCLWPAGLRGERSQLCSALRLGKLRSRGSNTGEGQSISWSVCARCS